MKKVLTAVLAVAAIVSGGAVSEAGIFGCGGCGPVRACYQGCGPTCGPVCAPSCVSYETKQLNCTRTVYDTMWKDVVVDCVRYEPKTEWVEKTCNVQVPHVEYVTKQVPYTVCKPVYQTVEKTITCYRTVPVTVDVTYTVDRGHWECQPCGGCCAPRRMARCGGCGGCNACYRPCPGHRVWVPNCVQETRPCTKYVCEPYTKTVPVQVCHYEQQQMVRDVTYPVCTYETVQKTYKCAVTTCVAVPYQVTKKVPYCVPREVQYTVNVCVPVYNSCPPPSCCAY